MTTNAPELPVTRPSANGDLHSRVQKLRLGDHLGSAKPTRGGAVWLPWSLCILLALAWAGIGIRGYRAAPAAAATSDAPVATSGAQANSTPSNTPAPLAGSIALEVKGYLTPAQQIAVSPIDVSGRVVELNIVEGKKYKVGEVLAKLEDTNFRAQVDEAKAGVVSADKKLESAKAKLAALLPGSVRPIEINQVQEELREYEAQRGFAQDEVERLAKLGGGAAAERELNQAKFDYQGACAKVLKLKATLEMLKEGPRIETKTAAEADVRSAEADVTAANARLAQADWRLKNCTILAPVTGTVLSKKVELYNLVNPLAFAATSGSICDLADLSDLEVDLEVAQRDIQKLTKVSRCRIVADAYPERPYDGTLDRIMPIANRSAGTIKLRVKVKLPAGEEPGSILKPEMGVVVTFLTNEK